MLNTRKKLSVVTMLRDRELNLKNSACFSTVKIIRRLLSSDNELYTKKWTKTSQKEIYYEKGSLFFEDYQECYSVNALDMQTKQSPSFLRMENNNVKVIRGAISYSGRNASQNIAETCQCGSKQCICLSPCLLSTSYDNWLYQHLMRNGKLIKKVYLSDNLNFALNVWNIYGESFSLTGLLYFPEEEDVVEHLLVLTLPLQFYIHLEVKRSVFGSDVNYASLKNNLLLVVGEQCAFYDYAEFLKLGKLNPYRLGDNYKDGGKIGSYPTGLPLNFSYDEAPPVLFIYASFEATREHFFCSYPYQYITLHYYEPALSPNDGIYGVRIYETESGSSVQLNKPWFIKYGQTANHIGYHPDNSNRIIYQTDEFLEIYKITRERNHSRISKQFSFLGESSETVLGNRKMNRLSICVRNFYYEAELDVIGILAKRFNDGSVFVRLYDNVTGEDLRTIEINEIDSNLEDCLFYIHPYAIIIHDTKFSSEELQAVHVYMM